MQFDLNLDLTERDLTDERAARFAAQLTDFNFDTFDEYTAASRIHQYRCRQGSEAQGPDRRK